MSDDARVAIVTGSATGVGKAVALRLARNGVSVVVNYSKSNTGCYKFIVFYNLLFLVNAFYDDSNMYFLFYSTLS